MLREDGYGLLPITQVELQRIADFSCGLVALDEFIGSTALAFHQARISYTTVVFHEDVAGPVGYFTLCNDAIPLKSSEELELGLNLTEKFSTFPAVKLGKFAVREDLQRDGNGSSVLRLMFGEIISDDSLSAARLIVVDANNSDDVIEFYLRNGFKESLWAAQQRGARARQRGGSIKMLRDVLE